MSINANCRNEVVLKGNVGNPPRLLKLEHGSALHKVYFEMVTRELRKRDGKWYEHEEWHRMTAVGDIAERIAKKVGKGTHLYVEGKLATVEFDDKKAGIRKTVTFVRVRNFDVLGRGL